MRTVIGVCYPQLEEHITNMPDLQIVDVCGHKEELVKSCYEFNPELVVLSNLLSGSISMEEVILQLISDQIIKPRIVYLYGEDDGGAKQFCQFLEQRGINEYYVGYNITSLELEKLINSAVCRESIQSVNKSKSGSKNTSGIFRGLINSRRNNNEFITTGGLAERMVISIYSAHVTGKSHTAWNLAYCLSKLNYKTSVINIDKGYSANIYYGIDEAYHGLLEYTIKNDSYDRIINSCYKRKNLNIVTGRLGNEDSISSDELSKLLYQVRAKSDITVIDTSSEISSTTISAIKSSSVDLLVFDSDLAHFHSNKQVIKHMGNDFIPEKTIAVINNSVKGSESYKYIYNQIKKMKMDFKAVLPISSCGSVSCDVMHTDKVPYQIVHSRSNGFCGDMDKLLTTLNLKQKHNISRKLL